MVNRTITILLACLIAGLVPAHHGSAASLKIAPILIEVPRGATSKLRLQNLETYPVDVQIRVFRWVQENGKDKLVPTRDVVASPPFAKIKPGGRNVIRLVRLSKRPIRGEESYRLLIDEIPRKSRQATNAIGFAVRYSLPVFFGRTRPADNQIVWTVSQRNGITRVTATNPGERRVRLSAMRIKSATGRSVSFGNGLVGYVLGKSTAKWQARGTLGKAGTKTRLTITANTENGTIQSEARLKAAQ